MSICRHNDYFICLCVCLSVGHGRMDWTGLRYHDGGVKQIKTWCSSDKYTGTVIARRGESDLPSDKTVSDSR